MTREQEFLMEALRGNTSAVAFCVMLGQISQVWDDFVDGETVSVGQMSAAFSNALIYLPLNPFYSANFAQLHPLVTSAILEWQVANRLERGTPHERSIAFVIRDRLVAVVLQCAWLVGGQEWAIEIGPKIYQFFFDETLEQYVGAHS